MTNATMILLSLVVGLILGLGVAFVLRLIQGKADIDAVIDNVLKLAKDKLESEREINVHELDAKKGLIDQQLQSMTGELEKVSKLMRDLERDRSRASLKRFRNSCGIWRGTELRNSANWPTNCRRRMRRLQRSCRLRARYAKRWQAPRQEGSGAKGWPKMSCGLLVLSRM